ncbi:MAG: stage sporulation protein, partial [Firmicutes bacterium]|nr:stage sporulation protein [Bacillota bacterium]
YVRDLSKQIRATVMAISGVADAKVTVNIETDTPQPNKKMGKIKNVVIYIEPGITANEQKIAKVTVGITIPEAAQESKLLSTVVVDKVTRAITELYQIKSSQVEVRRMN